MNANIYTCSPTELEASKAKETARLATLRRLVQAGK